MYNKSDNPNSVFQYHIRTYGDQSKFGYKDFIPMFKLEKFDPAEWAELYAQAGAKFAGPVAEHHDGFSMWASKVNRWNAGAMGPKRDVVGELVREDNRKETRRRSDSMHPGREKRLQPLKRIVDLTWRGGHEYFLDSLDDGVEDLLFVFEMTED